MIQDLKDWLDKKGLPTSGVKAQLIQRIEENLDS